MKTTAKMDQLELVEHLESIESQCQQHGITPPNRTGDIIADVEAAEAVLGNHVPTAKASEGAPAQKPKLTATETLQRASELYEELTTENRQAFLDRRGDEVRQLIRDAETETANQGNL